MGEERQGVEQQTSRHFTDVAQPKEPQNIAPSGCVLWGISGCVLWVASVVVFWISCLLHPIKEEAIPISTLLVYFAVLALPVCFLASIIFLLLFRALFRLFKG